MGFTNYDSNKPALEQAQRHIRTALHPEHAKEPEHATEATVRKLQVWRFRVRQRNRVGSIRVCGTLRDRPTSKVPTWHRLREQRPRGIEVESYWVRFASFGSTTREI
jgi:hypothetical protein